MTLYFITGNKNKFEEVSKIINNIEQLNIDLPEIQEIDPKKVIEEKLKTALNKVSEGEFIVEDTSLYFECLNGLPGPLIKWFLETLGNEGLYDIAKKYNNFNATAKTVIGYANQNKEILFFEGNVKGHIVFPKGPDNFGWDRIFVPDGYDLRFSEMEKEQKNKISMRGIATKLLKKHLDSE